MENSITLTVTDGTEYRLTYDNETGDKMHYLLHENGVLKLECNHHTLPGDMTEEEFTSAVVPMAFLNCLGRALYDTQLKQEAEGYKDASPMAYELAKLLKPHLPLEPDQVEYVSSIEERGHATELFGQLAREWQVERFARQLNAELPDVEEPAEVSRPVGVRQFFATYYPAISFAVAVVLVVVGYMLLVG